MKAKLEPKPHYVFVCTDQSCRKPTQLPVDAIEKEFRSLGHSARDDWHVAFPCRFCKRVQMRSLHRDSGYYGPSAMIKDCIPIADAACVMRLICAEETHEFPVPLFGIWTPTTTVAEREADIRTWRGENLKCPEGHSIFVPKVPD